MKLLWKMYAEWEPETEFVQGIPQFLGYVEKELKAKKNTN